MSKLCQNQAKSGPETHTVKAQWDILLNYKIAFYDFAFQVYIQHKIKGKFVQGRTKEIKVTVTGAGVPLRLAVGVSVGAISLVLIIFLILFIFWKRKYPAYTQIERGEDGAGKYCLSFFPLYFDLLLNNRGITEE